MKALENNRDLAKSKSGAPDYKLTWPKPAIQSNASILAAVNLNAWH